MAAAFAGAADDGVTTVDDAHGKLVVYSGAAGCSFHDLQRDLRIFGLPWGMLGDEEPPQSFFEFGGDYDLPSIQLIKRRVEATVGRPVGGNLFVRYYKEGGPSAPTRDINFNPNGVSVFVTIGAPCHFGSANVLTGDLTVLPLASGSIVAYDGVFNVHHYHKVLETKSDVSRHPRICLRWTMARDAAAWSAPAAKQLMEVWHRFHIGARANEAKARLKALEPWRVRPHSPMVPGGLSRGEAFLFRPLALAKVPEHAHASKRRRVKE